MRKSKKPVGLVLMSQELIAGLGNIFRAEVLFKVRRAHKVPFPTHHHHHPLPYPPARHLCTAPLSTTHHMCVPSMCGYAGTCPSPSKCQLPLALPHAPTPHVLRAGTLRSLPTYDLEIR